MHKLLKNSPRGGGGGISPVRTDPDLVFHCITIHLKYKYCFGNIFIKSNLFLSFD